MKLTWNGHTHLAILRNLSSLPTSQTRSIAVLQRSFSWLLIILFALLGGYLVRDRLGPLDENIELNLDTYAPEPLVIQNRPRHEPKAPVQSEKLRIASFHITAFDTSKAANTKIMGVLAEVVRNFDVIAVQGIKSRDQTFMVEFLALVNRDGSEYEYEVGPRVGRNGNKEQFAFLFNQSTTEIDRQATYTVADPHDRILHEPLVSLFRVRSPRSETAFTFKLVNVHLDPMNTSEELATLSDVYRVVLNDVDREDDVILLGNFSADQDRLLAWGNAFGVRPAGQAGSSTTLAAKSTDHLCLHNKATTEFNGKTGMVDMVRVFNLTSQESKIVSEHFPVWAEFTAWEGGRSSRFAKRKASR